MDRAGQIAFGHSRRHFGDSADLIRQIGGQKIHIPDQVLPRSRRAGHVGLTSQPSLDADFARHVGDLFGECRQRVGHVVDRLSQSRDFTFRFDRQFLAQVAFRNGSHDLYNSAHLVGQVDGHDVDRVRKVFPCSAHARHHGLTAELAFGSNLARHARDFGGERVELIHHGVDGVFQFKDLAFDVHSNLSRQIAARHGRRDFCDVSHLSRQVGAHGVHGVGEVFPGSGDAGHDGLHAEAAFSTDLAGDACHFGCEGSQLFHHRVDGFFQLKDFAADIDGDFAGQVAVGNGNRHFRNIPDLRRQVTGH